MCYGAICKGFGQTMYWDQPDQKTRDRRSRNAGCGTSHKCDSGEQCDEFPFASTSNSDKVSAISRCVPSEQNSRKHIPPDAQTNAALYANMGILQAKALR